MEKFIKIAIVIMTPLVVAGLYFGFYKERAKVSHKKSSADSKIEEMLKDSVEETKESEESEETEESEESEEETDRNETIAEDLQETRYINPVGNTLETRILAPEGFVRTPTSEDSLLSFFRNLKLKPDGSPVMLYDNTEKGNQSVQAAVFAIDVGDSDLQQCADSIMRVFSEYFWSIGAYEKISFHLTNGFIMDYLSWREGKRIKVNGNTVSWVSSATYDDSYDCFRDYLKQVMIYAGTLSLSKECTEITLDHLQPGDIIIKGGSPGHCILIVDVAQNQEGEKCYLLAQGYMPAQDFHVLNNPADSENPWYYNKDLEYPIETPQYTFEEGSLKRWGGW